ncbi:ABC transporter permease [Virgibacillus oceani]|uniref:Permease n=1 Tax=Virgibacillus oceani TaxID=1479511 RepID=A0A917HQY6_9BACI|nr:ABC transporter permease [Virgibacillus oceani]GGG86524.1 permease [Virgibacillus oceani]
MIWIIVKKQLLVFWRNPQQLLLLLGLPIILIAILGASLGGLMEGGPVSIDAKVAFIEHGNEQTQIDQFLNEVENSKLPKDAITAINNSTEKMTPITILKEDILGSDELKNIIDLEIIKPREKANVLNNKEYAAVIEVPENFTYQTLKSIYLKKGTTGEIQVYKNEGNQLGSTIVTGILQEYQEQLSFSTFAGKQGITEEALQVDPNAIIGETVTINQKNPVTAKNYYAVGMAVMNVLFIASTIGSIAFLEKRRHVFNRVILADVSRWVYFIGIFISGTIVGFFHLSIVYGVSWVLFGLSWPNPLGFFVVTLGLAVSVGGLSVLLTAICFRLNSEMITNFFGSIIVTVFAFLGGSFFPIGDLSKAIQVVGNYTPNGAALTAYLAILRGDGISAVLDQFAFLIMFAAVLVTIAAISFPKRGQIV